MKCIFCGNEFDENADPPEHIIPEAMGNKELTCDNVCQVCNHKLSPIETNLIRAPHIVLARNILKVKGKRGEVPDFNFGESSIEGDPKSKARYVVRETGTDLEVFGQSDDDGKVIIKFSGKKFTEEKVKKIIQRKGISKVGFEICTYMEPNEGEEVREKVHETLRSLEKQGITCEIKINRNIRPWLNAKLTVNINGILRTYAKIAFEYYALHFPEYINTPSAEHFRRFIFEENDKTEDDLLEAFYDISLKESSIGVTLGDDEHFLMAKGGMVFIVLFGQPAVGIYMHPVEGEVPYYGAVGRAVFTTISVRDGLERTQVLKVPESLRGER